MTKRQQLSHTAGLIQLRNMKATVMKVMISDGKTLKPGDIVDVSGWRHTKNLVSNRYIKLIEDVVLEETKQAEKPKVTKKTKEVAK